MQHNTIGRYQIIREIGRGGMGHVFEAYDAMLHRKVALKLLLNQEEFSREREYFLKEAQNTAKLRHTNIVTVYAIEEEKGQIFFTMDLIEGNTLSNLLEKKRNFSSECFKCFGKSCKSSPLCS